VATSKTHYIYCDPHFMNNPYSHHVKLLKYTEEILSEKQLQFISILRADGKRKQSALEIRFRMLKDVKLFLDFALHFKNFIILVVRQEKIRIVVINLNADPIWLLGVVMIRKVLRLNFELSIRFIGTVDRWFFKISNRSLYFQILKPLLEEKDKFTAESSEYARLLSSHFQRRVDYLPYPPIGVNSATDGRLQVDDNTKARKALYIGTPRIDKGYLELPKIVERLVKNGWSCTIQGYVGKDGQMLETVEKLRKIQGVNLVENPPSDEDIRQFILATDIVLLPYSTTEYRYRNSAMNFNSLYLGKQTASYSSTTLYSTANALNLAIDLEQLLREDSAMSFISLKSSLNAVQAKANWVKFIT